MFIWFRHWHHQYFSGGSPFSSRGSCRASPTRHTSISWYYLPFWSCSFWVRYFTIYLNKITLKVISVSHFYSSVFTFQMPFVKWGNTPTRSTLLTISTWMPRCRPQCGCSELSATSIYLDLLFSSVCKFSKKATSNLKLLRLILSKSILSVIRRLVTLLSTQATLEACSEASMKQAQSATQAAKQMMNSPQEPSKELIDLQKKVAELEKGAARVPYF